MLVRKRKIRGSDRWIVELGPSDGIEDRERFVTAAIGKSAATEEGLALLRYWREHGEFPRDTSRRERRGDTSKARRREWTMAEAVAHYRAHGLPRARPSTQRGYKGLLDGPGWGFWRGKLLSEVNNQSVEAWLAGLSKGTRRNHQSLLRSVCKSLIGIMIDAMPSMPPLKRPPRVTVQAADPEDVARLLAECKGRKDGLAIAIALGFHAGLRASEIRAIRAADVDMRRGVILIRRALVEKVETKTKSDHERTVPIGPALLEYLRPRMQKLKDNPEGYVSTNRNGGRWCDSGLRQRAVTLCKRLGIDSTRIVHSLRHGFATQLFAARADAITVQGLLGHADLITTQRYAHYSEERARDAIAAMDRLVRGAEVIDLDSRRPRRKSSSGRN